MERIMAKTDLFRILRTSSLWMIFLVIPLGVATAYFLVSYSIWGMAFLFFTSLFLLYFSLGMEKTILVLLFLRINLDAFHSQISLSLASFRSFSLPSAVGIFILLLGAFHLLFKRGGLWKLPTVQAQTFFILSCFLSLPFSFNLANSLSELLELLSFIVLFLLIVDFTHSEQDVKRVVNCIVFSALIPLTVGLIQIANNINISVGLEPSYRVFSTLTHPNAFAFYLVIISVLAISVLMGTKNLAGRFWYFVLLGFLLISLLYTFTRSAWLGLAFAVLIL